jgi:hypothetical protein
VPARHIEIVTTKAQRRARPKVMHAVVTLGALFVIFASQLLLSIAVSDGAYQIAELQQTQKELSRTEAALAEDLEVLDSTQNLVANAASLGMVIGTNSAYLRLADGAVFAAPPGQIRYGCATMCGMVTNSLTTGLPLVTPGTGRSQGAVAGTTGTAGTATTQQTTSGTSATDGATGTAAPLTETQQPDGPTTNTLPAPVTR